jgi:hypothetical protein
MKSAKFSRVPSSIGVIVAVFAIVLGAVLPSQAASPSSSGRTGLPEVRGFSAKGTQQWRSPGATYIGSTTQDGGMYLIYLEPGRGVEDAAMRITLKKRG